MSTAKPKRVPLKDQFMQGWALHGLPESDITPEWQFHMFRRWRFDLAFPSQKVAIELDGFGFGHQSIAQRKKDNEKANTAVELGWRVLRFTVDDLKPGKIEATVELVCRVLCGLE